MSESEWNNMKKGVSLPDGTKFQAKYNGRIYKGEIVKGKWVIGGESYKSPSGAAMAVVKTKKGTTASVDGWKFWKIQRPGEDKWTKLSLLKRKGTGADPDTYKSIVRAHDEGKTRPQISDELGVGEHVVQLALAVEHGRREVLDELTSDDALSANEQRKLELLLEQEKRRLNAEFDERVQQELRRALDETVLPQYNKELAEYRQVVKSRKGVMNRDTYRHIISCLHPDRVTDSELKERYTKAFNAFSSLELLLCNEKEMPTSGLSIPTTYEEMMKRREEIKARRRGQSNDIRHRV